MPGVEPHPEEVIVPVARTCPLLGASSQVPLNVQEATMERAGWPRPTVCCLPIPGNVCAQCPESYPICVLFWLLRVGELGLFKILLLIYSK